MKRKMLVAVSLSLMVIGMSVAIGSAALVQMPVVAFSIGGGSVEFNQDSFLVVHDLVDGSFDIKNDPAFWYRVNGGVWNQVYEGGNPIMVAGATLELGIFGTKSDTNPAPTITSANGAYKGVETAPVTGNFIIYWNDYLASNFQLEDVTTNITILSGSMTPVPIPAAVWLLGSGLVGLVAIRRRKTK